MKIFRESKCRTNRAPKGGVLERSAGGGRRLKHTTRMEGYKTTPSTITSRAATTFRSCTKRLKFNRAKDFQPPAAALPLGAHNGSLGSSRARLLVRAALRHSQSRFPAIPAAFRLQHASCPTGAWR